MLNVDTTLLARRIKREPHGFFGRILWIKMSLISIVVPFDTFLLHGLSNPKHNGGTYHVWVDVHFNLEGIEIRSYQTANSMPCTWTISLESHISYEKTHFQRMHC